jgi:hypothetical protein
MDIKVGSIQLARFFVEHIASVENEENKANVTGGVFVRKATVHDIINNNTNYKLDPTEWIAP